MTTAGTMSDSRTSCSMPCGELGMHLKAAVVTAARLPSSPFLVSTLDVVGTTSASASSPSVVPLVCSVFEPARIATPQWAAVPSKGSELHSDGTCQPCVWFWKPGGCQNRQSCVYCHICHKDELKHRKKVKIANMRMSGPIVSMMAASPRPHSSGSKEECHVNINLPALLPSFANMGDGSSLQSPPGLDFSEAELDREAAEASTLTASTTTCCSTSSEDEPEEEPEEEEPIDSSEFDALSVGSVSEPENTQKKVDNKEHSGEAGSAQLPPGISSSGSVLHGSGDCKPCVWFWKAAGCQHGQSCFYCHLCPKSELKERKKAKIANIRVTQAISTVATTSSDDSNKIDTTTRCSDLEAALVLSRVCAEGVLFESTPDQHQGAVLEKETSEYAGTQQYECDLEILQGEQHVVRAPTCARTYLEGPPTLALSLEALAPVGIPTRGSASHGTGGCQPCAWFWKPGSCQHGQKCFYCHLCPKNEIKQRKKDKIAKIRVCEAMATTTCCSLFEEDTAVDC